MKLSPLQVARYQYSPKLPGMLRNGISDICVCSGGATESVADQEKIKALFPNTYGKNEITFQKGKNTSAPKKQIVGVILSGGQAPGGHNVICGLYDALKACDKENVLYGFKGGPSGLLEDDYLVFDDEYINQFRNTGGFDIIGSGRTKLETEEQFAVAEGVCKKHGITAIVIIGGLSYATLMTLFIVPVMYDLFYRKPPVNIDVGDDSLDDLPDDAAEFAAEFAARGGDREPWETPRKGFLRRKDRKETEK